MVKRGEIHEHAEQIEELFFEEGLGVAEIADRLNLREKRSTGPTLASTGPPSWVLRVDCPECEAAGGILTRTREHCDMEGVGAHRERIEKAVAEGFAPEPEDPMEEVLEGGDVTECVAKEVLEFETWDEYRTARDRIRHRQRREEGFTREKREEIRERDGNQCLLCLSADRLHVHHVDGDATNNEDDNLVTLCERCHRALHSERRGPSWLRDRVVEEGQDPEVVDAVLSEIT